MVHILFDVNSPKYQNFFNSQYGGGTIFRGIPFQRSYGVRQTGQGVGNVLSTLWRIISPSVKNFGQDLGQETLATGSRIFSNLSQGNDLKQIVKKEFEEGAKNLIDKRKDNYQRGGGKRKIIGRAYTRKKLRSDAFGPY